MGKTNFYLTNWAVSLVVFWSITLTSWLMFGIPSWWRLVAVTGILVPLLMGVRKPRIFGSIQKGENSE